MSLEMKVPGVGESITEVSIATWHKADGEYVERDEIIAELESDKATFELPAEASGTLQHRAAEGDTLDIGATICVIDESGAGGGNGQAAEAAPAQEPAAETAAPAANGSGGGTGKFYDMVVPGVGESITEVTIGAWNFKEGDTVEIDDVLCEIESDKATFELPAEAAGKLYIEANEGDTLEIGALICRIEEGVGGGSSDSGSAPAPAAASNGTNGQSTTAASGNGEQTYATGHASPAAAKIMAEKGLQSSDVQGSGRDGRITKTDAQQAQKAAPAPAKSAPAKKETAPAASNGAVGNGQAPEGRSEERQRMTQLRKTIARRLVAAKNETAMLTTFNEVNMEPIMSMRKKYKEQFKEKHEVGLGFMSFFTKACCTALQEFRAVNAAIDGTDMVYHDYVDISIAVSAPRGLVVPVIRDAQEMSFAGIEKEIIRLATRARDNKLTIEEMTGGTFTITNGGIFGSMLSTPIINVPQSAILGMHNIVERAVVENGQVVVRPMMYVALSYDHRIIDGRESVSFLVRVKQLLEDPARLLLEV